ncbi:MAG: hypothetical protein OIN87_08650 [Candidatus Methanoperedens sp.]|nr:hypothetical protein [Candidatus Methanoperedens sp.]
MGVKDNTLNEIDWERISYLQDLDDLNYAILEGHITMSKRIPLSPYIPDISGNMKLNDKQSQIEYMKRKIYPIRPATMEDEVAGDSS